MRALRKLQHEAPKSSFVFVNERGTPFSPDGFNWLVKRAGQKAGLPFQVQGEMEIIGLIHRQIGHVRVRVWLKEHNLTDRDADGDAYDEPREE